MLLYGITLAEALLAAPICTMYWSCFLSGEYTRERCLLWREHRRMLAVSLAALLGGLWLLTFVALSTEVGAGYWRRIVLLPFLWLCAATDFAKKTIPNRVLKAALLARLLLFLVEILREPTLLVEQVIFLLQGVLITGVIMFACYFVTKRALGEGDVKLFILMGAYCGANSTVNILLFSVVLTALAALAGLAMKKVKLNTTLPLAPMIWASFLLFYLLDLLGV